jgi:hypothetical protein
LKFQPRKNPRVRVLLILKLKYVEKKLNNREKKARKALMKEGLKHVFDITRVEIKMKGLIHEIPNADVYILPGTSTYVIFGVLNTPKMTASNSVTSVSKEEVFLGFEVL